MGGQVVRDALGAVGVLIQASHQPSKAGNACPSRFSHGSRPKRVTVKVRTKEGRALHLRLDIII